MADDPSPDRDDASPRPASPTARARRPGGATPLAAAPAAAADRPRPAPRAGDRDATPSVAELDPDAPPAEGPATDESATVAEGGAVKPSRAGRDLPAAIGVGVGLGAVILASLFLYRPSFAFLAGAAALYACYEVGHALRTVGIRVTLVPLLVGTVAMLTAAWLKGTDGLVVAVLVTVLGVVVWRLGDGAHGYTRDAAASVLVALYVPTLAGFAVLLAHPDDGAARVIAFVATVVCSDTGGYVTGVLFGRHPLAPIVSKGKTWEGSAGSAVFCAVAGVLLLTLTFHQEWWKGLLFGLAVMVTATVGDLGASMIKRDVGIKDYGRLLPGHGGVMDRLDSLLPCAAVAYLLLSAFAPV